MNPSLARRFASRILPAPAKAAIHAMSDKLEFDAAARRGLIPPRQLWPLVGGAETSAFTFSIAHKGSWIERPDPPEGAVAHEEATILQMLADEGLKLVEPNRYGG